MMIQGRDREILRRCYEQQFLLMEHIERYFFAGVCSQRARERVLELEREGWLRKERVAGMTGRRIIRLTREGIRLARGFNGSEIPQRGRLDLNTLEHDALVTDVAFRCGQIWDGSWIPEKAIDPGEFPHVPDGVFVFPSGRRVAVEIEKSLKGRRRFMAILERWRQVDVLAVLYVASCPQIYRGLQGFIAEGPTGTPFGLVHWEDLQGGTPFVWSTRGDLDLFRRRTF